MIKHVTRKLVFYSVALLVVEWAIPGFIVKGPLLGLLIAAGVFTVAFNLVEPIIRLILLPINIITMGLFSIFIHAAVFWAALQFLTRYFTIQQWQFSGASYAPLGITISPMEIGVVATVILAAMLVSFCVAVFEKIV
ncbi:MAG: phage holin family protein [Candidatus Roizmanbacteria bacterium]|nr:phage holin family protein [Candidatus Roizmanbacteria bacterium]